MAQTPGPEFTTDNSRIKPVTIVLAYGTCDASVEFPASMFETEVDLSGVEPSSYSINPPAAARYEAGTHTVEWTIQSNGRDDLQLEQTVVVYYPRCGTDSLGQTVGMYHATIDGEQYATVRVGCDCWLAENLRHTHYTDGTEIPNTTYYNNDTALLDEYGRLYTWDAAVRADASSNPMLTPDGDIQGACPEGWAIPTAADFLQLETYAGGADHLKSHDPRYWLGQYGGTTPGSGFDARPGGYYHQTQHSWRDLLGGGYFWTSGATNYHIAKCCEIGYYCSEIMIKEANKTLGYSVRCIAKQPVLRSDTTVIACDSFVWNGTTYTESGNYEYQYTGADGLGHIASLHLTINPIYIIEECKAISKGELPYKWHGKSCNSAGVWYDSLKTTAGCNCDSVYILTLKVNPDSNLSFTVNNVSFEMKFVEGGTFTMGCTSEQRNDCNDDERLTHEVTLSSYYMGETEVTQALWQAVMDSWPSTEPSSTYGAGDNYPAYYVSWNDIKGTNGFIERLNDSLSSQLGGRHFDLPTEAQWEFAARGGNYDCPNKYAGSDNIGDVAWYNGNSESKTHPVKGKSPNELGLYDMSGNIWEWCSDRYGGYETGVQTDPGGPGSGKHCVLRGGSWNNRAFSCRVSDRGSAYPVSRHSQSGFRLVLHP